MCKGEEGLKYWLQKRFNSAEHNTLWTGSEVIRCEKRSRGEKKGGGACRLCFDAAPPMIPDSGIMIQLVRSLTLTSERRILIDVVNTMLHLTNLHCILLKKSQFDRPNYLIDMSLICVTGWLQVGGWAVTKQILLAPPRFFPSNTNLSTEPHIPTPGGGGGGGGYGIEKGLPKEKP